MYAHENLINGIDSGVYANAVGVTDTPSTLVTAPTVTSRFVLTDIIAVNAASTALMLTITGTSGQALSIGMAASGGGFAHAFRKPFRFGPGTLSVSTNNTPDDDVFVTICGFWLPN